MKPRIIAMAAPPISPQIPYFTFAALCSVIAKTSPLLPTVVSRLLAVYWTLAQCGVPQLPGEMVGRDGIARSHRPPRSPPPRERPGPSGAPAHPISQTPSPAGRVGVGRVL